MTKIITHPSVILIIGRRRFGKSALGYYILEKIHTDQPNLKIYVVSLPKEKHHLLPTWIQPVDDVEELPDNCVSLVDEGAMKYHAHKWHKKETEVMDKMISISGQRHQTFIFITHTLRKFAVTLLLDINILLVKKPSLLQMKLERSEFRKLIEEIDREFNKIPKEDVKKSVYVVSDDYKGFIRNPLPHFWSEDLSEAYAGININGKKEEEQPEEKFYPHRIEGGLKIWFKEQNLTTIMEALGLSQLGAVKVEDKYYYPFDLKRTGNKYHLTRPEFADTITDLYDQRQIVIDVETAYPLTLEDLVLKTIKTKKEEHEEKSELKEYAKKVELL